ncbi:MAG TPA: L-lactate dehydrogenase [Pyrinomonadaceae bacterium]|jgi:L-lactate dehydrogenase|nr:L-lactate dehydrogenase [Pyrinomonadaceae bacterium]
MTVVKHESVAVVGCGHVGATSAYALMASGLAREIVLVDADPRRAEGEAMDLRQAIALSRPVDVRAGDWRDAARSSIAVIAAGVGGRPGESRLDLLGRNAIVVREVMSRLLGEGFGGVVLMTTNPVDVLSQFAQEDSGLPVERVIGSGTVLDSARLRAMLGEELGVEPRSVHAHVIGEHGDSEIAAWSSARVAGVPLREFCAAAGRGELDFDALLARVRRAAPDIIERKGYTSYAIASCVARICEAVLRDEHSVLPVSTRLTGQYGISDVYLSLPCVVGRRGVERVVEIPLDEGELAGLRASAELLRRTAAGVRGA